MNKIKRYINIALATAISTNKKKHKKQNHANIAPRNRCAQRASLCLNCLFGKSMP